MEASTPNATESNPKRLTGPVACWVLSCDGSCGLLSVFYYGAEALSKPHPTIQECQEFSAKHGLPAGKVTAHARHGVHDGSPAKDAMCARAEAYQLHRVELLEALWLSIKYSGNWKLGYSAAFTEACENLRKLEAGQ